MVRKKKPQLKDYTTFVMDHSGSMNRVANDVLRTSNSLFEKIKEESKKNKIQNRMTLIDFSTRVELRYSDVDIEDLEPLPSYYTDDMTALLDAVGLAVETSASMKDAQAPGVSHLIMVLTDGLENASFRYNWEKLAKLIEEKTKLGNWTFVFQVPPNSKTLFTTRGIPEGNIKEWEATTRGVEEQAVRNYAGTQSYYAHRSKGFAASASFYHTPDLSNLKPEDLKKNLSDWQQYYQPYQVGKEVEIRPFVEAQTGKPYLKGTAFYQLTKQEKISWKKDVLIREKGKKAIWGGDEARKLIGLEAFKDAKVKPGNHANYDIFIQSDSTNRKLVRGTTLLVRK